MAEISTQSALQGSVFGASATPLAGVLNPQPPATLTIGADTGQLLNTTLSRDALGRITQQTDTIAGVTHTVDFGYDLAGRLQQVTRDGVSSATYTYGANGNRRSRTTPVETINATYDDQDRMLSYGPNRYAYRADGTLQSKTTAAGTTNYDYDVLGNLRGVDLPDGTRIDYLIDARNRRIGKEVNGTFSTNGFAERIGSRAFGGAAISLALRPAGNGVGMLVPGRGRWYVALFCGSKHGRNS